MHEKTLLYSALGFTAIAAIIGVYHVKSQSSPKIEIAPVSLIDSSRTLSSADIPVRLTASDGTGLKLVSLRADAAVEDPLALTELHLTFENPENRVLEGTFRITLPQGASLSRFAMKVGNTWQEGEVVEKQAARQAYEDFLHRRQDPALMEQGAGNEFSARVFPIPARGTKELIVTYSEAIEVGAPYVLPLRGLPQLGSLDVNVHVSGTLPSGNGKKKEADFGLHQQRFTPGGDFVVDAKQLPRSPGLRAGGLALARVVPFSSSRPEPLGSAIVLVDTSASRGLGLGEEIKTLRAVLAKLPKDARITVACFDQDVEPVFEGAAADFGDKQASAILSRGALGASDFEQALGWAGEQARKTKATRVVFVTDGVATAGETDAQKLRNKVETLRGVGVTRIDALANGGIRDDSFLRTVTRGVLDRDGVVLDAKLGPDAVARRLGEATSSGVAVKVDGARWSWPATLDGLQAGDEILVYSELDGDRPVQIDIGGQKFAPELRTIERPLVERAWAQAKIQSLIEAPKDSPSATKQQIIELSTSHRVISPYTSLLVLETDADYRRFNIDRTAKVDILTVHDGAVAVTESGRSWWESEAPKQKAEDTGARRKGGVWLPRAENSTADGLASATSTATAAAPAPMPAPDTNGPVGAFGRSAAATPPPAPAEQPADLRLGNGGGGAPGGSEGRGLGAIGGRDDSSATGAATERLRRAMGDSDQPPPPAASAAPMATEGPRHYLPSPASPPAARAAPRRVAPAPRPGPTQPCRCAAGDPLCTCLDSPAPTTTPPRAPAATVRPSTLSIEQGISSDQVQGVVRGAVAPIRVCYATELARSPSVSGTLSIAFVVDPSGAVKTANVTAPGSNDLKSCVAGVARGLRFAAPGSSSASFTQSFDLVSSGGSDTGGDLSAGNSRTLPYEGRFKTVMDALAHGNKDSALDEANRWHADQPGDILSLVALGETFEARGDLRSAARAYGSILELYSFRADSRRFAGERLERLKDERATALAIDTYAKAVEQRPDHPASHRLYAYALVKHGEYEKAFQAIKAGASRSYPPGRFRGVDRILKEDMGLIAAAWMRAEPGKADRIRTMLHDGGGTDEIGPSLRFVLVWETDANDVDFHIHDGKGGHAYYSQMQLPSGGELYADVTTGYGPECFTIRGPHDKLAFPYTLQAHYFSRGPMGYGMGKLQIIEHDGHGKLSFDERPFVVMVDHAFVDMGKVEKSTQLVAAK